jgi:hypothetical protein
MTTMARKPRVLVTIFITLGILGLGILGLRILGPGTIAAHAAGSQAVPFRGYYSGTSAFTSATTVTFSGAGISTYLGSSTNEGHVVVTGPDNSCPGGLANVNNETLTAANGDLLMFISYDVACPMRPGVFHGTGSWVVTGGTGRFSGATGQGTIDGYSDFNQGLFSFQMTGAVSAPM